MISELIIAEKDDANSSLIQVILFVILTYPTLAMLLCSKIFFIMFDICYAHALVKNLVDSVDARDVPHLEFDNSRAIIDNLAKSNSYYTGSVMWCCLTQIVATIFGSFYLGRNSFLDTLILLQLVDYAPYFTYFGMTFHFSALVNEDGDFITHTLARGLAKWRDDRQVSRMSMYIDIDDKPISYHVVGLRMTRRNFFIQISVYLISFIIGLIQSTLQP